MLILRNDLSKVCRPYTVKVTELFEIESYATVHHLVATVEGKLKEEQTAVDCMKACFPGGSITGTPKIRAMEVIEEEDILENVRTVGEFFRKRMMQMMENHPIIGDVKASGFLLGMELVKDRNTKEPFPEAGTLVYQKAFRKGLAWIPAGHILRMSPPLIMDEKYAEMGLSIIEESIAEVEKEHGYS